MITLKFQFLIGTVLHEEKNFSSGCHYFYVSIPYRYGITLAEYGMLDLLKEYPKFQFLIGTVLQQCFRCFPALSSFFLLKSH